ncbi:unnamed protein product [Ilex paraguariensis]|uniref:Uncharacterized protein n=1 Tax=Ilex paraguariensis TaxID=185542 RepID=A0ABC8V4G8_9AQUA
MLEVACGRKPVEPQLNNMILAEWVVERWVQGAILEASDPSLRGDFEVEEMELVLKLGLLCSHSNPVARPSMRQVMQYLNGDATLPEIMADAIGPDMFSVSMFLVGSREYNEYLSSFASSSGKASGYSMSTTDPILSQAALNLLALRLASELHLRCYEDFVMLLLMGLSPQASEESQLPCNPYLKLDPKAKLDDLSGPNFMASDIRFVLGGNRLSPAPCTRFGTSVFKPRVYGRSFCRQFLKITSIGGIILYDVALNQSF